MVDPSTNMMFPTSLNSARLVSSPSFSKHSFSLPVLSPRNPSRSFYSTKTWVKPHPDRFTQEKQEVAGLNHWNSVSLKEKQEKQQHAEYLNHYRSQYSEIDNLLMQWKSRNTLHTVSSKSTSESHMKHILGITQRRMEKTAQDQQSKELSKFSKRHEEDLEIKASELQMQLAGICARREDLRKKNSQLREELTESDSAIKASRISANRMEAALKSKMKTLRNEDLIFVFSKRSACQIDLVAQEQEYHEMMLRLNAEIKENSQLAESLDAEAKEIRQELRSVNASQVDHYRKILAEGTDTRSEGLAWAVKALWKLGEKVEVDMFPEFLELESVHVIIFIAQKSREIEELSEYMNQLQNTRRLSIASQPRIDRWNGVQERLSALKKPIKTARPVVSQANSVFVPLPETVSPIQPYSPSESKLIEDRIVSLRTLVQRTQDEELRRITHECFMNNLEQKVKVQAKQIMGAISGSEALSREMAVIAKEQKELADDLKKAKTFQFSSGGK